MLNTHEKRWKSPSAPTMVGIAVATTVPSIAAMNMQMTAAVMINVRLVLSATVLSSARVALAAPWALRSGVTAGSDTEKARYLSTRCVFRGGLIFFDPGPQLHLGGPGAAMLAMNREIA